MTVIIARDTPDAVRGMLKRWFIEPRANIFVGTINRRTREKTIAYLRAYAKDWSALLIHSDPGSQGFAIEHFGQPDRIGIERSGLQLIAEQWMDDAEKPF
jgi:CRISPR-associated protein Cas2